MNEEEKKAAEEKDRRASSCKAEIDEVLRRYKCEFHPFAFITADGRILANLAIVAKEG